MVEDWRSSSGARQTQETRSLPNLKERINVHHVPAREMLQAREAISDYPRVEALWLELEVAMWKKM
jgi:hypothetical protein